MGPIMNVERTERIAIYPGSFDPITNGHIWVIKRSLRVFDKVIIAVLQNESKNSLFNVEERMTMISDSIGSEAGVQVEAFDGLLVEYARKKQATAIVRGLRGVSDFEFELQMCNMNRRLSSDLISVFFMAEDRHSYVSSSLIKEVARLHGKVSGLVPDNVELKLLSRFGAGPGA